MPAGYVDEYDDDAELVAEFRELVEQVGFMEVNKELFMDFLKERQYSMVWAQGGLAFALGPVPAISGQGTDTVATSALVLDEEGTIRMLLAGGAEGRDRVFTLSN